MRKAQTSVFIIIGIILVSSFALIRMAVRDTPEGEILKSALLDSGPAQSYVTDCLYRISNDALTIIGQNGGYVYPHSPLDGGSAVSYYSTPSSNITYHYDIPIGMAGIEKTAKLYIEQEIWDCVNELNSLNQSYKINISGPPNANVSASSNHTNEKKGKNYEVIVMLELPVQITRKEQLTALSEFRVEIPVRLEKIYQKVECAKNLVKQNLTHTLLQLNDTLNDYLFSPCEQNDIDVIIFSDSGVDDSIFDQNDTLKIIDYNSTLEGIGSAAFVFQFAVNKTGNS